MDGSLLTTLAGLISVPLLVIITGGIAYGWLHHIRDCSAHRKDVRDAMHKLHMDIDERLDAIKDEIAANRESVARIEGKLSS